jgi:D-citramalate synthase
MDTTLRDGEQTPDVSYTPAEKLQLARILLSEVKVDRIEIASTRVSEGEREAARLITDWARKKRLLRGSRSSATATAAHRSTGWRASAGA